MTDKSHPTGRTIPLMDAPTPPVSAALRALGIPHRVFVHSGEVTSLEQAARERGQAPTQVVRSILFRLGSDRYAFVLVAGPAQIAWKALRAAVGQSRLTLASEPEVLAATGYVRGAVAPFGLPAPIPVFVDRAVLVDRELSMGSGVRNVAIMLSSADLQRALPDAVVAEFAAEGEA